MSLGIHASACLLSCASRELHIILLYSLTASMKGADGAGADVNMFKSM